MSKTVLVFAAHPDDAEFFAGGTLAKMAREGARVLMVIATNGDKGSFVHDPVTLSRLRAEEARRAAAVLGAEPPILLGHPDLELDRLPPGLLREQFVRLIRQHRPDVVFAQDPWCPFEVHPDHRAVAWAASDAVAFASLPSFYPEQIAEGLAPHFAVEKYFFTSEPSPADRVVDIEETLEVKIAALAEHRTQVEFLVEDARRQVEAAGLEIGSILGAEAADPLALLAWAVERQAAEIGRAAGFLYGEAFRYSRFHPVVEALLTPPEARRSF
ncbi:MAG: PIG-L deacetylase family protein [Chloroflexia bacterium]